QSPSPSQPHHQQQLLFPCPYRSHQSPYLLRRSSFESPSLYSPLLGSHPLSPQPPPHPHYPHPSTHLLPPHPPPPHPPPSHSPLPHSPLSPPPPHPASIRTVRNTPSRSCGPAESWSHAWASSY
ncbi:unnamed protein product, partial [Closterium sp. NIES-53]